MIRDAVAAFIVAVFVMLTAVNLIVETRAPPTTTDGEPPKTGPTLPTIPPVTLPTVPDVTLPTLPSVTLPP